MGRKPILTGIFVILLVIGIVYGIKKAKGPKLQVPQTPTVEEKIEGVFNLTIPEDVERIDLKGTEGFEGLGLATRKFQNGKFTLTILADLPDPLGNQFYRAWLTQDETKLVSLGTLRVAKGGYLLEFTSSTDYSDYQRVVVSLEETLTARPTQTVLEGSF